MHGFHDSSTLSALQISLILTLDEDFENLSHAWSRRQFHIFCNDTRPRRTGAGVRAYDLTLLRPRAQHRAIPLARPAKCGLDNDLRGAPGEPTVVRLANDVLPRGLISYNRRLQACDEPAVGPAAADNGAVPLGLSVRGDAHARPWYRPLLVRDRRAGQAC